MMLSRLSIAAAAATLWLVPVSAQAETVINLTPPGDVRLTLPVETGEETTEPVVSPRAKSEGWSGSSSAHTPPAPDLRPTLQTRHFGARSNLVCSLAEQQGSLKVINVGLEPLPPGTRIKWQVQGSDERDFFALIRGLEIGETLMAEGIVGEAAPSGAGCLARVI